ncbi:MAG: hypothetical protein LBJ59_06365 [Zoogloeaceae bacterium]|jgi:putative alpha-1,2-mannosidase|nr:hypothetical protein [Zoogloeaceae bacterium]
MMIRLTDFRPALLGLVLLGGVSAPALAAHNENICCNDETGQLICGDVLPPQCNGRALKIYNSQGLLIREVSVRVNTPTKEAVVELTDKQQEEIDRRRLQARKDRALLETYSSVADIDRMQTRSEEDVKLVIKNANALIADARKRKSTLDSEAEFYANSKVPADLVQQIRKEESTIKAQNSLLTIKQKELEQIRAKYTEDRRRYLQLMQEKRDQ